MFVDTTFLVARFGEGDRYHKQAKAFLEAHQAAGGGRLRLVLNDYVFDEAVTALRYRTRRHDVARLAGEVLRNSRTTETLPVPRPLLEKAWTLFVGQPDKLWSVTDCVSFVMMEELGLR